MKKLSLILVIIFVLISILPAGAATKKEEVNTAALGEYLQSNYGYIDTVIGGIEVGYDVVKDGDMYEIRSYLDYQLFNDIQYGLYKQSVKKQATAQVSEFVRSLYKYVTSKYPGIKWGGYFESSFTNILNQDVTLRYFNWANYHSKGIPSDIIWLTYRDAEWALAICENLEK